MTPERVETSDGDSGYSDASLNSAPARQNYIAGRRSRISRTKPNCNKCKNHKEVKALSGHKRYCPYQHCSCELCLLTDERRRVMAAQTRQKRAQPSLRELKVSLEISAKETVDTAVAMLARFSECENLCYGFLGRRILCRIPDESGSALPFHSSKSSNVDVQDERNGLPLEMRAPVIPSQTTETSLSSPPIAPTSRVAVAYELKISRKIKKPVEEKETVVDSAHRLVCEFGVAYTVVPFALALLRRVGNYQLVSKIIIDIQEALLEKTRLTASLVHDRPPIFACGPNYVPEAHTNSFNGPFNTYRRYR